MGQTYEIGTIVFEHWAITNKLGSGSFGSVYELQRKDFGETYRAALKVITVPQNEAELKSALEEGMTSAQAEKYFYGMVEDVVREFSIMARLKGTANVVDYMDHLVVRHERGIGWDILIRMELLTPVLTYAYQHPLSRRDVIRLGIDMCRALELCQKYNVIHRDIKPENIFVSENGDFKLGDFGIARTIENTMSGLSQKGTYSYMAPEIFHGEEYGYSVDIYSLGIVLYRLLNKNRIPFLPSAPTPITHKDRDNALAKRMNGDALPKPFYSEGRLTEIILKACAYNPRDRYSSPALMRQELEAILYEQSESELIYPDGDLISLKENKYWSTPGNQGDGKSPKESGPDVTELIKGARNAAIGGRSISSSSRSRQHISTSGHSSARKKKDAGKQEARKKKVNTKKAALVATVLSLFAVGVVAVGAFLQYRSTERLNRFQSLMEKGTALAESDPQKALEIFDEAHLLYPDESSPYVSRAYTLYLAMEYDDCIAYIEDDLGLGKRFDVKTQSQLSEILGAAYFERGDYTEAASFFRLSTAGGDLTVPAMRDYAVALGRTGDVEAADEVLQRMYDAGADSDITDYVQGEVDFALKDYSVAEQRFLAVLNSSSNDLLQRRCIRSLGEVYRDCAELEAQGSEPPIEQAAQKSVQLLSETISKYGLDYDSVLWEMLAKAYYEAYRLEPADCSGYLQKSAEAFQKVLDLGIAKDYLYNNLFSIFYELQDFESAEKALEEYETAFPKAYAPHALRSMMLITIEGKKDQEDRDYQSAEDEYDTAGQLITGSDDASYYQQLSGLVQQLRQEGWLDSETGIAN